MICPVFGGFFMAIADSVPGVSGGTIAFIMGFYDRFITSFASILHGKEEAKLTAFKYLVQLGVGWIVGMTFAVTLLTGVFTYGIYQASSLFLGFVLASIPLIIREEKIVMVKDIKCLMFFLLGVAVVILLSVLNLSSVVHNMGFNPLTAIYVFIAGALAISAMVLPGISGSMLLMSFGLYVPIITAIKDLFLFNFNNLWILVFFGCGVLGGIVLSLPGIKKLLDCHRSIVVYTVLGMMVGSLYAICMGPTTLNVPQHMMTLSDFNIIWFVVGCVVVFGLGFFKSRMKKQKEVENV